MKSIGLGMNVVVIRKSLVHGKKMYPPGMAQGDVGFGERRPVELSDIEFEFAALAGMQFVGRTKIQGKWPLAQTQVDE